MKLLLLGPKGQLGSDIARAARARAGEFCVAGLGRDAVDVTETERLGEVLDERAFDALINCTSYHRTDEAEGRADLAIAVNAHAVQAMAAACARRGARFLHISTDYVFGGYPAGRPLVEEDPVAPVNVYGMSKAYGEILARLCHRDTLILRVASLFGVAGASGKGGNFVETMIRAGRERGALRVVSDQFMSPTASADVADMALALLAAESPPGVYHAVNSGQASWWEFATEILGRAGVAAQVTAIRAQDYPTAARRPACSVLDNAKISATIGAPAPWQDALHRYLHAAGHSR